DNTGIKVTLRTKKGLQKQVSATIFRPDIIHHKIHRTGMVGFNFGSNTMEIGDLYTVTIHLADNRIIQKGCLGDRGALHDMFVRYEIPRDDFSILNIPTEELLADGPDIINVKK